ncbi:MULTISPECIES: hypothetical protein [Bradyrhizobium]|nr:MULTISPECIES: hypothetical protein [unclassified Bradyrhizobium]
MPIIRIMSDIGMLPPIMFIMPPPILPGDGAVLRGASDGVAGLAAGASF